MWHRKNSIYVVFMSVNYNSNDEMDDRYPRYCVVDEQQQETSGNQKYRSTYLPYTQFTQLPSSPKCVIYKRKTLDRRERIHFCVIVDEETKWVFFL
jgi:hypothetical protein